MSGFGTMQAALVLLSVSEDVRGRLMGIQSMAIGVLPLGSLIMGALAEIWSPQPGGGCHSNYRLRPHRDMGDVRQRDATPVIRL